MNDSDYPTAPIGEEQRSSRGQLRRSRCCCPSFSEFRLSDGVIRGIFLLLGVGILIPWNAFVSAKPYFTSRFCQSGRDIVNFEQWFGLVWNLSSVISLGLIIAGQAFFAYLKKKNPSVGGMDNSAADPTQEVDLVEDNESNSASTSGTGNLGSNKNTSFYKVMVPLGLYTVVFSIQAVLVTIPDISPTNFLIVTLVSLALCGTCGAIATAGIVSTAGFFPPHLGINPFFSGQALGGAAVSIANFAAIAIGEDPNDYLEEHCGSSTTNHTEESMLAAHLSRVSITTTSRRLQDDVGGSCSPYHNLDWAVLSYFLAGCVVLLLCLVGYHTVHQYQSMRDLYETLDDPRNEQRETNSSDETYSDESPRIGLELNDRIRQQREIESNIDGDDENQIEPDTFSDEREENTDPDGPKSVMAVIKGPATCIFLTFTITLSLFPSWISELKSSHECENQYRLDNDLYVPFSFVFFNIGDLLGRLISGYIPVHKIQHLSRKLVVSAILRVLFLPAFLMCSTTLGSESNMVVHNDFFSLSVQLLFAVSNGILISTSFMLSPQLVGTDSNLQERASEIMTFAVSFGLLIGSFLAFPFMRFATHLFT